MATWSTLDDFNRLMNSGRLMELIREGVAEAVAKKRALGLMPLEDDAEDTPAPVQARPAPKATRAPASSRKRAVA
jgi:hypothetical protein